MALVPIHGSVGYFNLDNAAGSPIDLTDYVKEVNLTLDIQVHDVTTLGHTSRVKVVGLKDGKFTVTFINDSVIMTQLFALWTTQALRTWVVGPRGSTAGYQKITGEAWLTSLPINVQVDDVEMIQASFEVSDAASLTTF